MHKRISFVLYKSAAAARAITAAIPAEAPITPAEELLSLAGGVVVGPELVLVVLFLLPVGLEVAVEWLPFPVSVEVSLL